MELFNLINPAEFMLIVFATTSLVFVKDRLNKY